MAFPTLLMDAVHEGYAMRPVAFAALISASLAACCLATPSLGETVAAAGPVRTAEAASLTVRDGSDAGPATQPVVLDSAQADDANGATDLPRIATHAPTPLGRPVASGNSQ
jgi:hypothetical protein